MRRNKHFELQNDAMQSGVLAPVLSAVLYAVQVQTKKGMQSICVRLKSEAVQPAVHLLIERAYARRSGCGQRFLAPVHTARLVGFLVSNITEYRRITSQYT